MEKNKNKKISSRRNFLKKGAGAAAAIGVVAAGGNLLSGCGNDSAPQGQSVSSDGMYTTPEFEWRFQVVHTPAMPDYKQFEEVCDEVFNATRGRMKISLYPNGSFAMSTEAFQACGEGVFDMHSSWPFYLKGIDYAFIPLADGNMSMSPSDRIFFVEKGGGRELMQEAFDKLNLQFISYRIWISDVLAARSDFKSIAEMKGKKFRTSMTDIAVDQGIGAISLPFEDAYTAMASGTVDMLESAYLSYNNYQGIPDIAPYGIYPDFWNCATVEAVVVNKAAWAKIPEDLKIIVKAVFDAKLVNAFAIAELESADALKSLSESGKVRFRRLAPDQFAQMRKDMIAIEDAEIAKQGPNSLTAKTYKAIRSFYTRYLPYKDLSAHWSQGLTPSQAAGFELPKYYKNADEE